MVDDRYGTDVLANGWRGHGRSESASVPAERGLVIEVQADGFCGAVTQADAATVELEDRFGMRRRFPLGPGFLLDGSHVADFPFFSLIRETSRPRLESTLLALARPREVLVQSSATRGLALALGHRPRALGARLATPFMGKLTCRQRSGLTTSTLPTSAPGGV